MDETDLHCECPVAGGDSNSKLNTQAVTAEQQSEKHHDEEMSLDVNTETLVKEQSSKVQDTGGQNSSIDEQLSRENTENKDNISMQSTASNCSDTSKETTTCSITSPSNDPCQSVVQTADHHVEKLKEGVLHRLTLSEAVFKSQSRDEPDLTYEEKIKLAADLLDNKTVSFFSRFGKHMTDADLPYLQHVKGHYMVDHCIEEIEKRCNSKQRIQHVRNRRYEAMKELTAAGEYFSDANMKSRDPLLYEHLVGKYQTEEEAAAVVGNIDRSDLRFSSILDKHMDILQDNIVYDVQRQYEESQMEEGDSDSESSEDEEDPTALSKTEKNMLHAELVNTMQRRFIDGQDTATFDYSVVDNNDDYDSLEIREVDEQEKYFDEES